MFKMSRYCTLVLLILISSCATVDDAGRAYFSQGTKVKGVEPADAALERMNKEKELRHIMYGQVKSTRIIQCTLLRNQFYVASMRSSPSKEVIDIAKVFEEAYQENDDAFLAACDQIIATEVGKRFLQIQQEYLAREK